MLTCTLQDDGVLGKKRTAPLQQADLVMLGLGVINLETHNEALLLKNLHKFFNKSDIPWVNLFWEKHYRNGKLPSHIKDDSFWWRDILKLLDAFKRMAMVNIQNGASCLFWVWYLGRTGTTSTIPRALFLCKKASTCRSKLSNKQNHYTVSFHLPLSVEAFAQMEQLQLVNNQPISGNPDWWQYIWGNTQFSSKKAYLHLTGHAQVPRLSNGYGNLVVKTNTKFSSGCYSRIALAREIY